jgi:hypothetical protein
MGTAKVIPFPRRVPSQAELDVYHRITRNWSPGVRRIVFPEHFRRSTHHTSGDLPSSLEHRPPNQ